VLRVSTATVYKMCARGELAHVRVLNVIRIPSGAVGTHPAGPCHQAVNQEKYRLY
jgi:hypothetical protein